MSIELTQWQWGYIIGFALGLVSGATLVANWRTWSKWRAAQKGQQ